jgi:hypothetical protein
MRVETSLFKKKKATIELYINNKHAFFLGSSCAKEEKQMKIFDA